MNKRTLVALGSALSLCACVTEMSNEERLERETARANLGASASADELLKLACDDIQSELLKNRDEAVPEGKRITVYMDLLKRASERKARFEESLNRNPDLAYNEGSDRIIASRDGCVQASADVRLDFEGLVREVMLLPVVDEYVDGKGVKVPRVDFKDLRAAIEQLGLDDKEQLFTRLGNAEKNVEVRPASGGKKR